MRRGWVRFGAVCGLAMVVGLPGRGCAQPSPAAVKGFNAYAGVVEGRLAEEHRSESGFLAGEAGTDEGRARLRKGEVMVEMVTPPAGTELPGALLHDWRATAFAPGATAADFVRTMRDFDAWPRIYAPQVMRARLVSANGDHFEATMRVRQKRVITVVMDTDWDVRFGRLDAQHGWSVSRSTRIAEVEGAGTKEERELSEGEGHGFLWRSNTYWSYEERDGGLYMQVESVSLTRGIPLGLGWVVRPFVESVPRDSLEFTLQATAKAVRQPVARSQKPGAESLGKQGMIAKRKR